ncbi:Sec-independent protein translocase protein TatB [Pseudomonadota bacterium]
MFDIGFWEIILISVVALLVVGPNEFPTLVRNIGHGMGKVRGFLSSVKTDLDYEIDKANEVKRLMEKEGEIADLHRMIQENSAKEALQASEAAKLNQTDGNTSSTESDPGASKPVDSRNKAE